MKVLVAGVGNIFLSDDGFGPEVARQLPTAALPEGVEVVDFGIRGIHLAYQLMDGYDHLIVIDTVDREAEPGTLFLIETEVKGSAPQKQAVSDGAIPLLDAHGMEPGSMLGMIDELGAQVPRVTVIGCQAGDLSEGIGLTPAIAAAIPSAVEMVREVLAESTSEPEERSKT